MEPLFNTNGLMFWTEREIRLRRQFEDHFAAEMKTILLAENPAWQFIQIEGPQLTPRSKINPNYTNDDVWAQEGEEDLVLRPETTPSSYEYACHLLKNHSGVKPPFVIWQAGKSFRREQDQVTKNMRLKEFYQQEFQCIYAADTLNDYHTAVLEPVRNMLEEMVGLPSRVVKSDRLPSYSEITTDVEVRIENYVFVEEKDEWTIQFIPEENMDEWMEICSISRRTDFPMKAKFQTKKKKIIEKDLLVLEVAIGLDRCVYNFEQRSR